MGCVAGAGAEVHQERSVRCHLLGVADHRDGAVRQIFGQVVALFPGQPVLGAHRFGRRVDELLILNQVRVVLAGLPAEEPVETFESPPAGPVTLRGRHVDLIRGCQMPFPDGVGVVAALAEDLGDCRRLKRDVTVGTRETHRQIGDTSHADGGVVASGEKRSAGG